MKEKKLNLKFLQFKFFLLAFISYTNIQFQLVIKQLVTIYASGMMHYPGNHVLISTFISVSCSVSAA